MILLVLLLYDIVLTLPDEVDLVWRRRVSAATAVLILNRAGAVLACVNLALGWINSVSL